MARSTSRSHSKDMYTCNSPPSLASQLREFHLVDDELVGILRGWIPACQGMPREDGNRELVRSDVDRRWPDRAVPSPSAIAHIQKTTVHGHCEHRPEREEHTHADWDAPSIGVGHPVVDGIVGARHLGGWRPARGRRAACEPGGATRKGMRGEYRTISPATRSQPRGVGCCCGRAQEERK